MQRLSLSLLLACMLLALQLPVTAAAASAVAPQPDLESSLLQLHAGTDSQLDSLSAVATDALADAELSLRVPASPDMSCVLLNDAAFQSSACTNVDWKTFAWIKQQQVATRALDWVLTDAF